MKYFGKIGFGITREKVVDGKTNGVWVNEIVEKPYYGDMLRWVNRRNNKDKLNDDIDINNEISVLADPFIYDNVQNILYVTWMNSKWKVNSVDIAYPRITLNIGGVYNGEQA